MSEKTTILLFLKGYLKAIFYLLLDKAFIMWVILIIVNVYNFVDSKSWGYFNDNIRYLPDVFTRLPRGIELLFLILFFLSGSVGLGVFGLKVFRLQWENKFEEAVFACALGLIFFTFIILGIGLVGFLQQSLLFTLLGLSNLAAFWHFWQIYRRWRAIQITKPKLFKLEKDKLKFSWGLALKVSLAIFLAFYLYLNLLGALSGSFSWDAGWYYTAPSKHYAEAGRIYNYVESTHTGVAALPFYETMIYTGLIKMGGLMTTKLFSWSLVLLTVLALISFCQVFFKSSVTGLLAALIFISIPLINWTAVTALLDAPLLLYSLLPLHAFLRWRNNPSQTGWLVLGGILSSYAMGSKLFGAYTLALLGLGIIVYSYLQRPAGQKLLATTVRLGGVLILTGLGVLITVLPWFVRNYLDTGNPVFPAFNNFFKSPYWNEIGDAHVNIYRTAVIHSIWKFLTLPWDAAVLSSYGSLLGALFLVLLPLCIGVWFFGKKDSNLTNYRIISIYLVLWMALWYSAGVVHSELRYAQSMVVIGAILVAFVLTKQNWSGLAGKSFLFSLSIAMFVMIVLNNPLLVVFNKFTNYYGLQAEYPFITWDYLYHNKYADVSRIEEVFAKKWNLPVLEFINKNLSPEKDKIYDSIGFIHYAAYSDVPLYNGYEYDSPTFLGKWSLFTPDALQQLKKAKVTHILLNYGSIAIEQFPIAPYLEQVYKGSEGAAIYRIKYPAEIPEIPMPAFINPIVLENSDGTTDLFIMEKTGSLSYRQRLRDSNIWSKPIVLSPALKGIQPAVLRDSTGVLSVFAQGKNNHLYLLQRKVNDNWGQWQDLGGEILDTPAVGLYNDNTFAVFVRGQGNQLFTRQQGSDGKWADWQNLGRTLLGQPAIAKNLNGKLEVFIVQADNQVSSLQLQSSNQWDDKWNLLGGNLKDSPVVVRYSDGSLGLFGRGLNNGLYSRKKQLDGKWADWEMLATAAMENPAFGFNLTGNLKVFVRNYNTTLSSRQRLADDTWTPWWDVEINGLMAGPLIKQNQGITGFELFIKLNPNEYFSRKTLGDNVWIPGLQPAGF